MPRNGSGTYTLPEPPFVPGTTISSTAVNSDFSDAAAALTGSIAKNGETTYTGNQPMGGNKLTGLGVGTALTDSVNMSQIAAGTATYGGVGGGTADAITITPSPGITAYAIGQRFSFKASGANTGAVTLNVNTVGAGAVVWANGTALVAGDIPSGAMIEVEVQAVTPVFHLQTVAVPPVTGTVIRNTYVQTFTADGTYTPHAGMVKGLIEAWAGGGGGAGVSGTGANTYTSGSGGGGGYSWLLTDAATIGASKAVVIGPGGTGGTAGANAGNAGTDTTVGGTLVVAKGGSGGAPASSTTWIGAPGAGGIAGTGTDPQPGQAGQNGSGAGGLITTVPAAGQGGASRGPGATGPVRNTAGTTAGNAAAANSGGGGSGAISINSATTAAGGNGGSGYVRITEYCSQ